MVVIVARVAKLWNVVDAVLLGIERYVPLEPSEIEQLSRGALGGSAARAPSAAGTTNPKKRKAAAKKPDEGRAKEAAGKGPEKELASLLRTDFASASESRAQRPRWVVFAWLTRPSASGRGMRSWTAMRAGVGENGRFSPAVMPGGTPRPPPATPSHRGRPCEGVV